MQQEFESRKSVRPVDGRTWAIGILLRSHLLRRHVHLAIAVGLASGYACLLAWFNRVDFYHHNFFEHGSAVTIYQIARLSFIPCLAWTIYAVGAFANFAAFGRTAFAELPPWERYPLFFITGAGIWHTVLFALGLAGLDIKPVAIALTLGAMSLSIPHLAECLGEVGRGISRVQFRLMVGGSATALVWLAIVTVSMIFLLVKGLYPGGGHDYYTHYFQFYKRVIETGSILPNDVWYHFYDSKGAGLYFLAMLLIDPLAPQLVATVFIGCGACMVYALLRNATRSAFLPLVGVLLYIGVFVYTPSAYGHGEWGILEKLHELTAVLVLAVIWIAYRYFRNNVAMSGPWALALHFAVISIALLTLQLVLLVGLYLAGYAAWFAAKRQWRVALRPFSAGVTAAFCLMAIGAINYFYTGFPLDHAMVPFWPYADLNKIMRWGTMLEVVWFHHDFSQRLVAAPAISWEIAPLIFQFLRLNLWWPLIVAAAPFVILKLWSSETRSNIAGQLDAPAWAALAWFAAAVILVALFGGGRSQPISFFRISSFAYAPMLCLALLVWHLGVTGLDITNVHEARRWPIALGLFVAALAIVGTLSNIRKIPQNFAPLLLNSFKSWTGAFSLLDAYQNRPLPAHPWGGIYPGIVEPWRIAGPGTRIWSFHISTYCMLPECNVQSFMSVRLSPSWQTILFGPADAGIKALKN